MEIQKIREFAAAACEEAKKAGAQHADSIISSSRSISLDVENNSIRSCDVEYDAGYCARAYVNGGAGFSRGRGLDFADIARSGSEAATMAGECETDPDFKSLPGKKDAESPSGLYDPEVAAFEPSRCVETGLKCVEAARAVDSGIIVKGGFSAFSGVAALANTNGVDVAERQTFVSFYVMCMVRRGDSVGSYYDYTQARRLSDLRSPEDVARCAAEKSLTFLGSRRMPSGTYPVVLGPLAAGSLLRGVIMASNAEDIQRGRSYMAGKRDQRVAPDALTIVEDPHVEAGLFSSAFDGEGVPRSSRRLIDSGVLKIYLHNSYTAGKAGEECTGHASRGSYMSSVGIGLSNISVLPGTDTEKSLIAGVKDGLYICMGSISPNLVTGQVSGTVDFGYRILNGEIAHPVENVMIGGDVFELLGALEAMSSDCRVEAGNVMPSALLGRAQVAGE